MSENKSIIVTGGSGLVGSKFIDVYRQKYNFESLDISDSQKPVDITNEQQVISAFSNSNAEFVVHFAAYTDVTGAFKQTGDKTGLAYQINVTGTQNIAKACQSFGKHLINISTAYVFDGSKQELYKEHDPISPIEWYGQTKAQAEIVVQECDAEWTILRIDQPFRSDTQVRPDIVRRIVQGLKEESLYPQFTDRFFGPTYIDDFAKVIDWVIRTKSTGMYHASSGEQWSDYEFAVAVKEVFKLETEIKRGDLDEYLKSNERPYQKNTAMDATKLKSEIDFKLKSVIEALGEVSL
jgi:dTDP-4-dehydrorhamnose reductase